jgi:hypothetical protein
VLSGRNNNSRNNAGFELIGLIFRAIIEGLYWHSVARTFAYSYDSHGNRYKTYSQQKEKKGTGFIKSVFYFVFGPDSPKFDPLANAREVAAYIRLRTKGKLTSANIIALSGVDYDIADSKLAEYSGKFKGDLNITNNGLLYGDFENMLQNISRNEEKYIEYYKDEIEPPVEFTGNTAEKNAVIILINFFNLFMSHSIMTGIIPVFREEYFFLAYFPFFVSLLYYIIPLLRLPNYLIKKSNRNKRVLHKILIGYICEQRKKDFTLSELMFIAKNKIDINAAEVQNMINQILPELQGTIEIRDDGSAVYVFERLFNELMFK